MVDIWDTENSNAISWNITRICNFNCIYCVSHNHSSNPAPIDKQKLLDGLNALGKNWLIHISGGEPFLVKNIVEICQVITKNHYLSINTNLSTDNFSNFASTVDPKRTLAINASVHIMERMKMKDGIGLYIKKMQLLQEKGFNVIANYVAYPELFDRITFDFNNLKANRIKNVQLKIFKGVYKNRYYPYAYTSEQKSLFESMGSNEIELERLYDSQHYRGNFCRAGRNFFVMDRAGNLRRCSGLNRGYGNLFNGSFKCDDKLRPCPAVTCGCSYEGIRYNMKTKAENKALLKEVIMEKCFKIYSYVKKPQSLNKLKDKSIEFLAKHRKIFSTRFDH
jgi:MoaA/NifB/PqqE/SkfB family radical SAM enzyme